MKNPQWYRIKVLEDNYIWLIEDKDTNTTIVVDPTLSEPVVEHLEKNDSKLTHILITHHHWDHIGGVNELKSKYNPTIIGAKKDSERLPSLDVSAVEGDIVKVGNLTFQIYETDGHTIGHLVYYEPKVGWAFVGDTLFALGCGRMFEGSPRQFVTGLNKIKSFDKKTLIFCAHEYTLANSRFALSIDPTNQSLIARTKKIRTDRASDRATVPFELWEDLQTNPFLRLDDNQLKINIQTADSTAHEVFAKLRSMKDKF